MIAMIGVIKGSYAWGGCTCVILSAVLTRAHCASAYSCVVTISNGPLPSASKKCRGERSAHPTDHRTSTGNGRGSAPAGALRIAAPHRGNGEAAAGPDARCGASRDASVGGPSVPQSGGTGGVTRRASCRRRVDPASVLVHHCENGHANRRSNPGQHDPDGLLLHSMAS